MLFHNLLIIYRNFRRFKSSFVINLVGLSTGLTCTLLIYLWVHDELNVDKFHKKDDQLFQVMERQQHDGSILVTNSTPWLLAETLKEGIPEIEYAAVATPAYWHEKSTLSVKGDNGIKASGLYTSNDYFSIFSYDLLQGDRNKVLSDKNSIVISRALALKLFNTTKGLIGKALEFQHEREYFISGIFEDIPANSSERFDFVLSFEILRDQNPQMVSWKNSGPNTFVVVKKGTNLSEFNKKITNIIKTKTDDTHRTLFAIHYSDNYLFGGYQNGVQVGGRIEYVRLFSIIAFFILVIACINFMNLSTAKASRRLKEIGIKKAIGARRKNLVFQYLGESLLMSFLSFLVAVIAVELLLPQFNLITNKQLSLNFDSNLILVSMGIIVLTGIIAGSYPALYLSGFNPAVVLKGKLQSSLGELWARKGLVIFQFAMSVIFIASVLVVYRQIEFVQTKNLGYNKDNVIYFEMEGKIKNGLDTFLEEVKKIPGVVNASSIAQSMVGGGNTTDLDWEGKDPNRVVPFAFRPVNYNALELMGVGIKAGRSFLKSSADSAKIIFNEAAIDAMGIDDPVGKTVHIGNNMLEIVGVVRNFHFESFHSNVSPMFFVLLPQFTNKVVVKIADEHQPETIDKIQKFYNQYNPDFVFNYRFLDDDYQAQYSGEMRVATLSKYFAGIAILISCLGLFGLASFTAERKSKEIGIRKVLGCSDFGIVYLLSIDFTKIVFVAIVIAIPVSYIMTKQWLDTFAYKIPLAWWYFVGAGVTALFISWLTVGSQAIQAARTNPTKSLKDD